MKKKKWKINKSAVWAAVYGILIVGSWVVVSVAGHQRERGKCKELVMHLRNSEANQFLDVEAVRNLVEEIQGRDVEDCRMDELRVSSLEYALKGNPYVEDAEVYKDVSSRLLVEIELRRPIARVMDMSGEGFYLDENFTKVDLSSRFTSNVPIVRGEFYEPILPRDTLRSKELEGVKEFLRFVDRNEFLRNQVSEIVIHKNGEVTMYPEVGDVVVHFGTPDRLNEKFENLMAFYKDVLNKTGWDKYSSISLKYKGQIVARQRRS
jgi:cell division protein FtsQ